ncbi:hypothetical protein D3C86_1176660 [compost metagenome]
MASTIITAPSTINPKSMAPRLIRFPLTPKRCIIVTAKSNDKGITEATTKPARQFPRSKTRMKITIKAPSIRFFSTVLIALSMSFVRSLNASIATPSGSDFSIWAIFAFTRLTTSALFSPLSIMATPLTSSPFPSFVTAPKRVLAPMRTVATSRTRIGIPFCVFTTIFPISSISVTIPIPRMK